MMVAVTHTALGKLHETLVSASAVFDTWNYNLILNDILFHKAF